MGSDRPVEIRWVKNLHLASKRGRHRAKEEHLGIQRPVSSFLQSFDAQLEDSFIRTQDDSMYVQGLGVRRVVFWNDVNGVPFLLTKVGEPSMEDHDIVVEDCTVWNPSFACPFINAKGSPAIKKR